MFNGNCQSFIIVGQLHSDRDRNIYLFTDWSAKLVSKWSEMK